MEDTGLSQRIRALEWRLRVTIALCAATTGAVLLSAWQRADHHNVITGKRVIIEDDKGVHRLILGAPAPDPVMGGKTQKRRSPFNGLVINDAAGNEQGAIGAMDDGTMVMCFDQKGRERVCSYVLPGGQAGVKVSDPQGNDRISLKSSSGTPPEIQILDEHEVPVASLRSTTQ